MSHFGVTPGPLRPAPPSRGAPAQIPLWVLVAAIAVMLALAGVAASLVLNASPAQAEKSYPSQWDSRIAPYAALAEKHRGLHFRHPVPVRFLPVAEFEKGVTTDEKELSKTDLAEIERFTGLLRAFGLLSGDLDLVESVNTLKGAGVLAYYSPEDERITIRGETLTAAARSTLIHELTHVLQDQNFDIGARLKKLSRESDEASTAAGSVLDAVIEGDAERVQALYVSSLPARQRKALVSAQRRDVDQASRRTGKVPGVLVTLMTSPYALGSGLVEAVAADGGNLAVDALFRKTPTHESSLLDPFRLLAGDTGATEVEVPKARKGEKRFEHGELGVLTWYLMLAERLPLLDALAAADGWGGDAYVAFERDDTSCARMSYAGRAPGDTTRMFSALQRWVAAAPGSPAEVERDGDLVRLESCDPGRATAPIKDVSQEAVELVATRNALGASLLRTGAPEARARCLAGRLVRAYPVARLVDPTFGAGDPAVAARVRRLAAGCR